MAKTEIASKSRLMSPNEAAFTTTMSKPLLRTMALKGVFPQPLLIGKKRIAYVRAEVEGWIDDRISGRVAAGAA